MTRTILPAVVLPIVFFLSGCAGAVVLGGPPPGPPVVVTEPPPGGPPGNLGIPPGHLPPPGECRIWIPGAPPGQQSPPGRCSELELRVPPGAWLLDRPKREEVRVSVSDASRPRVFVAVRFYDAETGNYLRGERR
jgi:hypothetical protein